MYDFKRHVGGDTDILDRGSIPLSSIMGLPRLRQGTRIGTETCLDKHTTSAKTDTPAANNIVAFSRPFSKVAKRDLVAV